MQEDADTVGQVAVDAIQNAGMHFKLRIPLTGNIKLARLGLTHIEEFKIRLGLGLWSRPRATCCCNI